MDNEQRVVVSPKDAADILGVAASTLAAWRMERKGPVFLKYGRAVRYRVADLQSWMDSRVVTEAG